jgi:hypothetical protein
MKKTFAAFVAVATIAGSLFATPASAQRGVAAGVAAPRRYYVPPYGAGPGPYDDFGSCEWVKQGFWDGRGWLDFRQLLTATERGRPLKHCRV